MPMAEYLRRQAQILAGMSRSTFDLGMACRLRGMAADFEATAAELDQCVLSPERESSEANARRVHS
jgi:hypothetical protein